jgi:ureidoacrylate peracid hydrolase
MPLKDWIAPLRTALLLIDMQVDFAADDGACARQGHDVRAAQAAVARATALADAARQAGVRCIFVRLLSRRGGETPMLKEWQARRGHGDDAPLCEEGTRGAAFIGPQPLAGDEIISKTRYSAFTGTGLAALLRGHGIDTLVLAGLTTECCIDTSARDAFENDFHVVIATDAVAAYEPALHRAALKALEINLAILADTAAISDAWK